MRGGRGEQRVRAALDLSRALNLAHQFVPLDVRSGVLGAMMGGGWRGGRENEERGREDGKTRTHFLHGLDRLHADLAHADMLKVALIPQRDHRVDDVLSGLAGRDTGARVDILRALLAQDRLRLLDLLAPEVETGVSDLPTCTLTAHSSDIVNSGVTHPLITSVILSLYSGYCR